MKVISKSNPVVVAALVPRPPSCHDSSIHLQAENTLLADEVWVLGHAVMISRRGRNIKGTGDPSIKHQIPRFGIQWRQAHSAIFSHEEATIRSRLLEISHVAATILHVWRISGHARFILETIGIESFHPRKKMQALFRCLRFFTLARVGNDGAPEFF